MFFIINFLNYLQNKNSNLAMQLYYKIFSFADEKEFIKFLKKNYKKEVEEFLKHKRKLEEIQKEKEI